MLGSSLFTHLRLTEAEPALMLGVINGFMTFGIIIVAKELMESSLKILYEAPETALLHAAPIQPVAIFGYQFIHLTITRFLSILCFLGPPWVAFGVIYGLPWHFYVALFPACLCLLIIIASYVTISMMVIARFFSSGELLTTLKALGTAIGVTLGFLISLALFTGLESTPINQYLLNWASTGATDAAATWYPHEWMGRLLLSWTTESTLGIRLRWVLGGCSVGLASVGLATLTAQQIYQRGWENIRQLKAKRKPARTDTDATTSNLKNIVLTLGRKSDTGDDAKRLSYLRQTHWTTHRHYDDHALFGGPHRHLICTREWVGCEHRSDSHRTDRTLWPPYYLRYQL